MQTHSLQYNNFYTNNDNDYDNNYFGNEENNYDFNDNNENNRNTNDYENENENENESNDPNDIPRIRVIVRKRPLSKKESSKDDFDIVELKSESKMVVKELK